MRNNQVFSLVAIASALAGTASDAPGATAASPAVPVAEIGTAVKAATASAVFGGGLLLPPSSLGLMLFEQGWTSHGASGEFKPDEEGWSPFSMRTSKRAGAPAIRGKARFSETGDGAVRGEWIATPEADAPILELAVAGRLAFGEVAGGRIVADGRETAVPPKFETGHVFRGKVSEFSLRNKAGAERLRIRFDAPTAVLLQDNRVWGGSDYSLRLFLAEGPVSGGVQYGLTAEFSTPALGLLALADGKPVVVERGEDWIPLASEPWIEPGSALDFSLVVPHHEPAGKFGRVVAVGDHFELEGRPGVPQRFYGVNICGDANTPSTPEAAERFAANLARIGYNSLRIHHHERSLLGGEYSPGMDDTVPDPAAMDRFDALVAACVRHGIYVTTDLFVSRSHFTEWRSLGIDRDGRIPDLQTFKNLCAFWEPACSNLCAWSRNFMLHVNPYTGRSLAKEPALCALALINEGNLGNYGAESLRDLPGVREAWEKWLDERSGDAAFADVPRTIPAELYADDGDTPQRRHCAAFAIFLSDMETKLADRLVAFVRDELGCAAPVSSLSCWYNPVQYQLARTRFDYVDDHFYVDHPAFLDKPWNLPSRCPNANPIRGAAAGARAVAFRRIAGKPFCITEWNYAGPGRYRGVGGIATGVLGALQDWSGMWRFAWSHGRAGVETPEKKALGYFDMSGDPLGLAAERAALCLFLRGDIAPLRTAYPLSFAESDLRDPACGAPKCAANDWLLAAWNARLSVNVARDGSARDGGGKGGPYAPLFRSYSEVRAELDKLGADRPGDGAVSIDRDAGTLLLDTPCTAGGFAESGKHRAGCIAFELRDAPATVWVSSLDGAPVAESSHLLLTHLTDVQNSGVKYGDAGLTILLGWGTLPHLMRRGSARIELSLAPSCGGDAPWRLYRLSASGRRVAETPFEFDGASGTLRFTADTAFDGNSATFLYELAK